MPEWEFCLGWRRFRLLPLRTRCQSSNRALIYHGHPEPAKKATEMSLAFGINGVAGRMGQRLVVCGNADKDLQLVAALDSSKSPVLGKDSGLHAGIEANSVSISDQLNTPCEVMIDFSTPAGAEAALDLCHQKRIPLVIATTGLSAEVEAKIDAAANDIPVLTAPNMSPSVNLAIHLAKVAARALKQTGQDADVEIIERHHRFKHDSPSGTALRFGEVIAKEMDLTAEAHGRHGMVGERPRNEIGYHAVRTGDDAGQHLIVFGMLGETIEVSVAATTRDGYARGALAAAKFLANQKPGRYSMEDVLAFA